jgi:hypothetical protein
MAHICNLSTWEVEAGRSRVQGQPELHSEILSQKKKNKMQSLSVFNSQLKIAPVMQMVMGT